VQHAMLQPRGNRVLSEDTRKDGHYGEQHCRAVLPEKEAAE